MYASGKVFFFSGQEYVRDTDTRETKRRSAEKALIARLPWCLLLVCFWITQRFFCVDEARAPVFLGAGLRTMVRVP
jgi:hypothetical protein